MPAITVVVAVTVPSPGVVLAVAVTVQVAVVAPAAIAIGEAQVVVYRALGVAAGVIATDRPPAGAAVLAVKVTVETLPAESFRAAGLAVTKIVGTAEVTTTEAELGAPIL